VIDPVNDFEQHVAARLLDFFGASTSWHRGLWNAGLCLMLKEVLEASEAVRVGVLHETSLGGLANSAQALAGTDPGAGTVPERQTVQGALRAKPRFAGLDYHTIAQHEESCRRTYFNRWSLALRSPQHPGAERTARLIAAHLLDLGYSSDYLHRWWKYHLHHEPAVRALADIVEEAQGLALAQPREFQVLVPVAKAVRWMTGPPPLEWRTPQQISEWLRHNRFDVANVRQDGGFLFAVQALDSDAAVVRISEVLDQLKARLAVGTRRALVVVGQVWIRGEAAPQPLDRTRRGVWVEALDRENQLFDMRPTGGIHAAIELLSHLQASSPGAAVAGGWAAIEALLSEPNDRAGAAERLAMLVACSYPRAELTSLSYVFERRDPGLALTLRPVQENRQRCSIVADALVAGTAQLAQLQRSDRAAAVRMSELERDSHRVLSDVQEHVATAFRRLYRQRNLVLHWGKTDGVALRASLRTTAPLVGAGIDRIIHAHYVDALSPLQLVARAKMALATVGTTNGPRCIEMLG
jgi:hypothetical protein